MHQTSPFCCQFLYGALFSLPTQLCFCLSLSREGERWLSQIFVLHVIGPFPDWSTIIFVSELSTALAQIVDALGSNPNGLDVETLKESLWTKHGFDFQSFSQDLGYANVTSCLLDMPGLSFSFTNGEQPHKLVLQLLSESSGLPLHMFSAEPFLDKPLSSNDSSVFPQKLAETEPGKYNGLILRDVFHFVPIIRPARNWINNKLVAYGCKMLLPIVMSDKYDLLIMKGSGMAQLSRMCPNWFQNSWSVFPAALLTYPIVAYEPHNWKFLLTSHQSAKDCDVRVTVTKAVSQVSSKSNSRPLWQQRGPACDVSRDNVSMEVSIRIYITFQLTKKPKTQTWNSLWRVKISHKTKNSTEWPIIGTRQCEWRSRAIICMLVFRTRG